MAKTLFVRVQPKSGQKTFFRCGMSFSQAWQKVDDVDAATAKRLEEEQMLEVSETEPEDYEGSTPNAGDPAGKSIPDGTSGTPAAAPEDTAERLEAIRAAIGQLDKADDTLWTVGGSPSVMAIVAITGWLVLASERDAVWAEITAQGAQ